MDLLPSLISAIADGDMTCVARIREIFRENRPKENALFAIADWHKNRGRFDKAILFYLRSLSLSPWLQSTYAGLSDCLWATGQQAAAIEVDLKCIELAPNMERHWVRGGMRMLEVGRCEEALSLFGKAVIAVPEGAAVHRGIETVFERVGRLAEGTAARARAEELEQR